MEFISRNIDTILTILSAFVIPFLGFIIFQLFRRPRLEIESIRMTGSRKRGAATNYPQNSVKPPYADELNYEYNFEIPFEFSILNNSEIDGYDAEIEFNGIEGINYRANGNLKFSPIPAHKSHFFQGKFFITKEAGYNNSPEIIEIQRHLRDKLSIKSKVKNKYRLKNFYAVFDGQENEFTLRKP
jgi:hypothetical protein